MSGTPQSAHLPNLPPLPPSAGSVAPISTIDGSHVAEIDAMLTDEEMPSFFGVLYKTGNEFRIAVEDCKINNGVHLEQAKGVHGSNRVCIKCKQAGCDFFVFAKKKDSRQMKGYLALANDIIKSKGIIIKQTFQHSGPCKLCPTGNGTGKVRRVSQNKQIRLHVQNHLLETRGRTYGILGSIRAESMRCERSTVMSKASCHRVKELIVGEDYKKQIESFKYLPRFLEEYEELNEGSITNLTTNPVGAFKAMFISFPTNINAAKKCGLRLCAIDAAHSCNPIMAYHVVEYVVLSSNKSNLRLAVGIIEGFERNFTYEYMGLHCRAITNWPLGESMTIPRDERATMQEALRAAERAVQQALHFYSREDTSIINPKRVEHLQNLRALHDTSTNLLLHEAQKNALALVHDKFEFLEHKIQTNRLIPSQRSTEISRLSPVESSTSLPELIESIAEPSDQSEPDQTVYEVGDEVYTRLHNCLIIPGTVVRVHLGEQR